MTLSPWLLLIAALPVLLIGERLVDRVQFLYRFNIPAPVVGGLMVAVAVLIANVSGYPVRIEGDVTSSWWNWLVLPEVEWVKHPGVDISRPFLVAFFACIGLNASWSFVRKASWQLPILLGLAGALAIIQNAVGITIARALGESPILGLICGSVSMTGGHGTALGFADVFVELGFPTAAVVGVAASTFGLVSGSLIGGPIGGSIIRKRHLKVALHHPEGAETPPPSEEAGPYGVVGELKTLARGGVPVITHLAILAFCIKAGAWVSLAIKSVGLTFPVYIGAMLVGITVRNVLESSGKFHLNTSTIDLFGSLSLGLFLSMAMMSLNLVELTAAAVPMLAILFTQVVIMGFYARYITFNLMGRDYDAAVMAAGHCGFSLGATPAAVANMRALTEEFGPAPRAFLVLPLVGAFLIDFVNAIIITTYLNLVL